MGDIVQSDLMGYVNNVELGVDGEYLCFYRGNVKVLFSKIRYECYEGHRSM
jgi:hypothetical protein